MKNIILSILFFFAISVVKSATFTAKAGVGDYNTAASWTQSGSDADGIPDADDPVVIGNGSTITVTNDNQFCWVLTVSSGGTLTFNNIDQFWCKHWIQLNGTINGTLSGANHVFNIGSTNAYYITGTGSMSITGNLKILKNFSLNGVTINNTGSILIDYCTVTNNAFVTLTGGGTVAGIYSASGWINGSNSTLSIEAAPMTTGSIQTTSINNTLTLSGNSTYSCTKLVNFYNLIISGSGTKSISSTNSPTISGSLTINAGASFTQNFWQLTIKGNLINNGTFTASSGKTTIFSGTALQTISGTGTTIKCEFNSTLFVPFTLLYL